MRIERWLIAWLLCAAITVPGFAADEADLEKTFEDALESLRQKDIDGLVAHFHPEAVMFLRNRYFPLDFAEIGLKGFNDMMRELSAAVLAADLRPTDFSYRVVNGVGMAWGFSQLSVDSRSGGGSNLQSRLSVTFVQSGGAWKIIQWHASALPGTAVRAMNP